MGLHQLGKLSLYVRFLQENPSEAKLLFKELLIGVTSFFRDPTVWELLKTDVIPSLLAALPHGGTLRAWVPACSTGEEAYTLAIIFREALEQMQPTAHYGLQVFATDLDDDAIDMARSGVYLANISADVSELRRQRFFLREEDRYRVKKEIRDMVIFAPQNLVMDPPFTKLDLLTCRNLLIYLEPDLQKKLLPLFHYSLNPGGVLVLGAAETIGSANELFAAVPGRTRIYQRKEAVRGQELVDLPAEFNRPRSRHKLAPPIAAPLPVAKTETNLKVLTTALLEQHFSPVAVLTTHQGDIIYISGKTGNYLEPATGEANLNLFAMARAGLASPLNEAFTRTLRSQSLVELRELRVVLNDRINIVNITVQQLAEPAPLAGKVLVVFNHVATRPLEDKPPGKNQRASTRDPQGEVQGQEIVQLRGALQTSREEMQLAQEELKSANEELQSTNEELQSTNEELTTSKEEMQSVNEELQSVNDELKAKLNELSMASDDMENLLSSTDIATLFLDNNLNVRRFTPRVTSLFRLLSNDVGRPITDIVNSLDFPSLETDVRQVLGSQILHEFSVAARDEQWFRIRIMPYRTQHDNIEGVVITFTDLSVSRSLEATLREAQSILETRVTAQNKEFVLAEKLKEVLRKTHETLEQRFSLQTDELSVSRAELRKEIKTNQKPPAKNSARPTP